MAPPDMKRQRHRLQPEAALAGMLALLVDERESRARDDKEARKTEVLLARAGLAVDDIAAVMGKNTDAVRKTIQRGRN